jgi:hypothetical protein
MSRLVPIFVTIACHGLAIAGPFPPAVGEAGSDAVSAGDPRFISWATTAVVERGSTEIGYPESFLASYGLDTAAIGPADATPESPYPVVSLGDGGVATLGFSQPFSDIPGPDFAVFENGFSPSFLELAHVEVSSDGENFFRFPSTSLTVAPGNPGEGGSVNPTDVRNLAGKYLAGHGTPFDLAELRHFFPLLDVQRITHVRVIDVVGTNDPAFASLDAAGNIIIDPYPTPYPSAGFDLDAVGAFAVTANSFASWQQAQGIVANGPSDDANHNGVVDLIEYLSGTRGVSVSSVRVGFDRLSYRTDRMLWLEGGADLKSWTKLAKSESGGSMISLLAGVNVSESGGQAVRVSVTLSPEMPFRYFRLAAE